MFLALLTACTTLPQNLATDGLGEVAFATRGFWFAETLENVQTGEQEMVHQFLLTDRDRTCADFQATWTFDIDEALAEESAAVRASIEPVPRCEALRDYYAAYAELTAAWTDPGVDLWMTLWNTQDRDLDNHIGVLPDDGVTYTPIDGPDADVVEWVGDWDWVRENGYRAAGQVDCTEADTEDPFGTLDDGAVRGEAAGRLTFTERPDRWGIELDVQLLELDGRVTGFAVLERCDVRRLVDPPTAID